MYVNIRSAFPTQVVFMFAWRSIAIGLAAGAFVSLATPTSTLAQSGCNVEQLTRESIGQYRLAVMVDGSWQLFDSNDSETVHVLQNGASRELCLAWEAPAYRGNNRQIVYVSTQYRDDQPLWLSRNSAIAQVPFVGRLLGDWSRAPGASGADPDESFREFHDTLPEDPDGAPWNNLAHWHDTSVWLTNRRSYELVSVTAAEADFLPYGTERLLVLAARRPLASWIPFTSYAPSPQDRLRVAVSYSGDLEMLGPRVHRYEFEVR